MKQAFVILSASVILFSCQSSADHAAAIESAKQAAVDSVNTVIAIKKQVEDSMKAVKIEHERNASVANSAAASTTTTTTTTTAPKKKGWSHTAKGAVVGAGAGAITGALINKNHAQGAVIGTLIGAGVGAGTGAIVDKKKKQKEQQQQQQQ